MDFTSIDYRNTDFRNEQDLFKQFYYDEIHTAPGLSWCTEYYYRRMPDGKYRFIMIDSRDNELYAHEEYNSPEKFAREIRTVGSEDEGLDDALLEMILSLCPKDIRRYRRIVRSQFNDRTASLLQDAYYEGYRDLVKALLPNFEEIRARIYPVPYIPGIAAKELERRKEMLREYYQLKGYIEEEPNYFKKDDNRPFLYSINIGKYTIDLSTHWHGYCNRSTILLEDTDKLRKMYPKIDFGPKRG